MIINDNVMREEEKMIFTLRSLYSQSGFSSYKMNKFEEYDLYAGNKDFLVSQGIITFTDTSGRLMALKPDVTLSIVKNSKYTPGQAQRLYYDEKVYRISNGVYREITQMGLEEIGDIGTDDISGVLSLACESLQKISDDYILTVSHPGIISAMLDTLNISSIVKQEILTFIQSKSYHEIVRILTENGCNENRINDLIVLLKTTGTEKVLDQIAALLPDEISHNLLEEMKSAMSQLDPGRIRIDFSVPCNMHYYSGIVFAGYVKGIHAALLTGGMYDLLLRRLGKQGKAIGFAIYLDLLEEKRK